MPWIDPTAGNLNWYALIRQITRAILHRRQVIGYFYGANVSRVWFDIGTVPGGVTETSFTTVQAWRGGVGSGDGVYADPWNGNEIDIYAPASWLLVFDHCDPDLVVKTPIVSWTNAGQITYQNVRDFVTSKQISAIGDLVGRRALIVRGDHPKWTDDLVYEWPNDREQAKGFVAQYHDDPDHPSTVTNPTHTTLKDDVGYYGGADVVGHDLLVYADDGFLKRVTITAFADRTFTFAEQSWTPDVGKPYCIVNAGGRAYPRHGLDGPWKETTTPFAWYRGLRTSVQSTFLGTPGFVNKPVELLELPVSVDGSCTVAPIKAMDAFIRTADQPDPLDMACGQLPEYYYSPDRDKTLRGLQCAIEELGPYFVKMASYSGQDYVDYLLPAALFEALGYDTIGITGHTVTGGGGNAITFASSIAASLPHDPIKVHWLLRRAHDGNYKGGTGKLTASGLLADARPSGIDWFGPDDDDTGVTLLIAFGWTGFPVQEFAQLFPRTGWIADVSDGLALEHDPLEIHYDDTGCTGLGVWFRRPKSTVYLKARTDDGFVREGLLLETGKTFTVGDLAMYAGRPFEAPNVIGFSGTPVEVDDPQGVYFGKMAVTHLTGGDESARTSAKSGRVAAGSTVRKVVCDEADFWFGGGVLRIESGTATGGSTTTLVDSTKTAEPDQCSWHAARFNGFASPYATFVVEVLMSGTDFDDEGAVIEKALVATGNESTGTLTWLAAYTLSASANGKQWRIREPRYELNCWEGRKVTVTMGTQTATRTIVANDDTTLFLDTDLPFAPDDSATYRIDDPVIGSVMRYTADGWVIATGADAVRVGVTAPADFTRNPTYNLPGLLRRYGRHTMRDVVCAKVFKQMQDALDQLQWIHLPASWSNRDITTPAVSVDNGIGAGVTDCAGDYDASDTVNYIHKGDAPGVADAHYEHAPCPASSVAADVPAPPKALYKWQRSYHVSTDTLNPEGEYTGDASQVTIDANWSRLVVTLPQTRGCGMGSTASIDYYVWSQVDAADSPDGTEIDSAGHLDKYTFEAGHDPFLYHKWALAATTASADAVAGGDYQSSRIGGGSGPTPLAPGRPPAPPEPPPWDPDTSGGKTYFSYGGFYLSDWLAVVKYTFPIPS